MGELDLFIKRAGEGQVKTMNVSGREELMVTAHGVLNAVYIGWRRDHNAKCKHVVKRYCQYIALHGYRGGWKRAYALLKSADKPEGLNFLSNTLTRYVENQYAMMQYIMQEEVW